MKLKGRDNEPLLRSVDWGLDGSGNQIVKDTPKIKDGDDRRLKLELKLLNQPPKVKEKVIVPD